ncbi:MAG: hypothetical protein MUC29_09250 [Pyrinomonadaceae bacterium]|nr:hypothetical protein [Pyrinomonadaceae bacterium]
MKKLLLTILAVALISMFSLVAFGQQKKGNRPNQPTTTATPQPRVKKPVSNSTDSVADYNRQNNQQNRQANQQEKQAQRQTQQQERQAQREAKQQERQNNQANRQANKQQNTGETNTRGLRKNQQGAANNNAQSATSANASTKPCNQLSGGDWLYKGRKCTLENGQVTTVGAYQRSQGNVDGTAKTPNASGNRRANRQNSANTTDTNSSETNTNPRRRQNRNNPPSNIPGATVTPNNSNLPNIPGATVTPTNPNLPNIPGATVTPNPSNNSNQSTLPNSSPGNQAQTNPPNGNNQANPFGFPYPQRPEDIVTWNPDGGEYGFTTTDQGWEFIMTNAGVAIRRAGREGTVVAHTKCNDTENYDFQQTGNGTRISRIMCIPKRAGLPKLRPSIMIVPQSEYFNNQNNQR